jgi:hypothetical protein
METGEPAAEGRDPAGQADAMRHPSQRHRDREVRNNALRAQLARTALPEIPGWLDDAESDDESGRLRSPHSHGLPNRADTERRAGKVVSLTPPHI